MEKVTTRKAARAVEKAPEPLKEEKPVLEPFKVAYKKGVGGIGMPCAVGVSPSILNLLKFVFVGNSAD